MVRNKERELRVMNYMTQKVRKDIIRAKDENDARIQRVLTALLGQDERDDFIKILEYYKLTR